ncbi:1358_t:CDS:1, partial [Ambispora leptoticha]
MAGNRGALFNVFGKPKSNTGDNITLEESLELTTVPPNGPIDAKSLVSELQNPYPLPTRVKLVKQLCDIVTKYTLSNVTEVWVPVRDLLSPNMPQDARHVAFQFMISCIQGQYNELGLLRAIFYDSIKAHEVAEDFSIKFETLRELCKDGRDISSFEKNIGKLLSEWINQTIKRMEEDMESLTTSPSPPSEYHNINMTTIEHSKLQSIINLLINVVKFNFTQFEEHDIKIFINDIATVCKHRFADLTDIQCCQSFCDVVVRYGYVPISSLNIYVNMLCTTINHASFLQQSWHIMHNLLRSHCAFSSIKILCNNLEYADNMESPQLLCGSVLFLGRALWGPEEVDNLTYTFTTTLTAMRKATTYKISEVNREILVQIGDLVSKNEKKISFLEWEVILDILENTQYLVLDSVNGEKLILEDIKSIENNDEEENNQKHTVMSAYSRLIFLIQSLHMSNSFEGPTSRFMSLIQNLCGYVSENTLLMLLDYYDIEHLLYPSSSDWIVTLSEVVNSFFNNAKSSPKVRQRVLSLVVDVYQAAKDFFQDEIVNQIIIPMFSNFQEEQNLIVWQSLMIFLIEVLKEVSDQWTMSLLQILIQCVLSCECHSQIDLRNSHLNSCKSLSATIGLLEIFQHSLYEMDYSSQKINVYTQLMSILADFTAPSTSRLVILQLMLRMRVDYNHRVYFVHDLGTASGAHILHRDSNDEDKISALQSDKNQMNNSGGSSSNDGKLERKKSWKPRIEKKSSIKDLASAILDRDRKNTTTQDIQDSQSTPTERKENNKTHARNKSGDEGSIPPIQQRLWHIPDSIPFKLTATRPSPYVVTYRSALTPAEQVGMEIMPHDNEATSTVNSDNQKYCIVLSISMYLDVLIDILANDRDWEIFSYVLCYLPLQLSEKHVFCGATNQILALKQTLCDRILNNRLAEGIFLPPEIKKVDIYIIAYQTLTVLISYRSIFQKAQRDELVLAFHVGLQKWPHAAKFCLHALNVCCYELPMSMTKLLSDILAKLSQIITTATMSVHILEFLCTLARLPDLYINFTEADFKRVFGIAMQYIQYSKALSASSMSPSTTPQSSTPTSSTSSNSSSAGNNSSQQSTNALIQYERIMAYHVIYSWFVSIKLPERRKYVPYIVRNLLLGNEASQQVDEQTETCFDMLARCSYANCDPKPSDSFISQLLLEQGKDKVVLRTWIQGNALVTIRTLKSLGWAETIIRRPSATMKFLCKLENRNRIDDKDFVSLPAMLMAHYDPDAQDIINTPTFSEQLTQNQMESKKTDNEPGKNNEDQSFEETTTVEGFSLPQDILETHLAASIQDNKSSFPKNDITISEIPSDHNNANACNGSQEKSTTNEPTISNKRRILDEIFVDPTNSSEKLAYRKDDPYVDPSFLFLQFSPYPDIISKVGPRPLPDDEATRRALDIFDRTAVVDFHKIGIVYIAKGQTKESEILANIHGSPEYIKFLNNLGDLVRLKDNKDVYTGGLDTQMDLDGEYSYYWKDDIVQVIFHCTTLMPTNLSIDPQCNGKKRHIGNDFVRIIYNDSGKEYAFDTIPGQFNFINIVISPLSYDSFLRQKSSPAFTNDVGGGLNNLEINTFFKVQMQCLADMPETSSITEFKMVSLTALPAFVRNIALHANIFAQVFLQSGGKRGSVEYVSNWRERLRQIKRIKERILNNSVSHMSSNTFPSITQTSVSSALGSSNTSVGFTNISSTSNFAGSAEEHQFQTHSTSVLGLEP